MADRTADKVPDPAWQASMKLLQKLLYEAGQKSQAEFEQDSVEIREIEPLFPKSHDGQVMIKLLWGYHYFYYLPYTAQSLENFAEAFRLSKQGIHEERKFALYSILRVYNWELLQSNEDVVEHMKTYKKYLDDNADEFHYKMSEFIFHLRNIDHEVNIGDQFVESFETLMDSFTPDHHFWIEYYITLGIYTRHFGFEDRNDRMVDEAFDLFKLAIDRMGDEPYLRYLNFRVYVQLSEVARYKEDFNQALVYLNEAEKYSYLNDSTRAQYYLNLYRAANLYGIDEKDSAYYALSRADTLEGDLGALRNSLHNSRLTLKLKLEKIEQKAEDKTREAEEKARALNWTRNWLLVAIGTLVFVTIVYFLLQLNSRKKRLLAIQDKNIQSQKVTNLLKEQELLALNSMIEGQEKERKRIAEDLHDRLGSTLSAVKMHMEVLADGDTKFSKISTIIDKAVNDTREIAHNMLSGVLKKFGLIAALRDLKETVESANQLRIVLKSEQFDERLESEMELHIYRIIQELISNTLKHAKASKVSVLIKKIDPQNIIVSYSDDGIGFDPQQEKWGVGLRNIQSRLERIQGSMTMNSAHMKGMEINIHLKIDN